MKQIIPFKKDITFKTKIGEITSISLDNDLMLKGEDLISGNFFLSGTYKMLEASTKEETYSYKIPCEIAISDEYDTFDSTIDIDDFHYEVKDDILSVNIVVAIDNLNKKETEVEENISSEKIENNTDTDSDTILLDDRCYDETEDNVSFLEIKEKAKNENDEYLTYKIYIFKEGDSINNIIEKYKTTIEELADYNDLNSITVGSKIVIPSSND